MAGLVALAAAYILSQFFRSFLAVLAPDLIGELGVSEADLSFASGIWFLGFAFAQFPVGSSLDRLGPRRTAFVLLLVAAAGALLFAAANGALAITVAMAMTGIGSAATLMATFFIFARIYPPRRLAMFGSWFVAVGLVGNVMGSAPMALAVEAFGWRAVMVATAAVTLVSAAAVAAFVKDPPAAVSGPAGGKTRGSVLDLLRIRALWPVIAITAVAYAPAANLRGLWAGPFLADIHAMSTAAIGTATLVMSLALIAGSILYGPLDIVFRTRKWVPLVGSLMTALCVAALALFGSASSTLAVVLLSAAVLFGSNYSMIMAHGRSFIPPHLVGRGVTLLNFFTIGGAGLIQFVSGWVFGAAAQAMGAAASYAVLFGFYAVLLLAGTVAYLFSRDQNPVAAETEEMARA